MRALVLMYIRRQVPSVSVGEMCAAFCGLPETVDRSTKRLARAWLNDFIYTNSVRMTLALNEIVFRYCSTRHIPIARWWLIFSCWADILLLFIASKLMSLILLCSLWFKGVQNFWRPKLDAINSNILAHSALSRSYALNQRATVERGICSDLLKWNIEFFGSRKFRRFVLHE